jgi:hypothetical protein
MRDFEIMKYLIGEIVKIMKEIGRIEERGEGGRWDKECRWDK